MMELYKKYEKEVYGKVKLYDRSTTEELKSFKVNKSKNKDESPKEELKDVKSDWKDKGKDWTPKKKQNARKEKETQVLELIKHVKSLQHLNKLVMEKNGKYIWSNGDEYEGDWENEEINGTFKSSKETTMENGNLI
jgi:hypothetical protein